MYKLESIQKSADFCNVLLGVGEWCHLLVAHENHVYLLVVPHFAMC